MSTSETTKLYNSSNVSLPDTYKGDTWDGFTWAISSVDSEDTRFANTLSLVRFQLQGSDGNVALTLSSATPGEVTIDTATANAWAVTVEPRILSVDAGDYFFGLEFTDSASNVKTFLSGSLQILADPVV